MNANRHLVAVQVKSRLYTAKDDELVLSPTAGSEAVDLFDAETCQRSLATRLAHTMLMRCTRSGGLTTGKRKSERSVVSRQAR